MSALRWVAVPRGDNAKAVEIFDGEKYWSSVSVNRSRSFASDTASPATVNWPGCGNQSPEVARAFALAILSACDLAEAMDSTTEATS